MKRVISSIFKWWSNKYWIIAQRIYRVALAHTSEFYLSNAHIHHHGSCGVMSFDKGGQITAVHFLNSAQVRLAVTGNQFGALFVYIQATI